MKIDDDPTRQKNVRPRFNIMNAGTNAYNVVRIVNNNNILVGAVNVDDDVYT